MKLFVRVAGILIRDDNVLLHQSQRQGKNYTALPGGHLEAGETSVQCLQREMQEEFGIDVEVGALVYVAEGFFIGGRKKPKQKHELALYYVMHTSAKPETIKSREPQIQAVWQPVNQLTTLYPHWLRTRLAVDAAAGWPVGVQHIIADERHYSGDGNTKSSDSITG